jgi:hypothetical protein
MLRVGPGSAFRCMLIDIENAYMTNALKHMHALCIPGCPSHLQIAFSVDMTKYMCALHFPGRPGRLCIASSLPCMYMTENVKHMCALCFLNIVVTHTLHSSEKQA